MSEGNYGSTLYPNHTYKALRVIGQDYNLLYTVWCSGEHEIYDLINDPYELQNLWGNPSNPFTYLPDMSSSPRTISAARADSPTGP